MGIVTMELAIASPASLASVAHCLHALHPARTMVFVGLSDLKCNVFVTKDSLDMTVPR
jgi:hypothetical protein